MGPNLFTTIYIKNWIKKIKYWNDNNMCEHVLYMFYICLLQIIVAEQKLIFKSQVNVYFNK